MGICWYCHWGWSQPVYEVYSKYYQLLGGDQFLDFGIGHIVWSDENFETENIEWCIKYAEEVRPKVGKDANEYSVFNEMTMEDFNLTIKALQELLLIPEDIRCPEPKEYQEKNRLDTYEVDPKDYPPPANIIMMKKY